MSQRSATFAYFLCASLRLNKKAPGFCRGLIFKKSFLQLCRTFHQHRCLIIQHFHKTTLDGVRTVVVFIF